MSAEPVRVAELAPAVRLQMGTVVIHRLFNDQLGVVLEAGAGGWWWVWWGNAAKLTDPDDLIRVPTPLVDITDDALRGELARRGCLVLGTPEPVSGLRLVFSALEGGDVSLHIEGEAVLMRGKPCRLGRDAAEAMLADLHAVLRGGR